MSNNDIVGIAGITTQIAIIVIYIVWFLAEKLKSKIINYEKTDNDPVFDTTAVSGTKYWYT